MPATVALENELQTTGKSRLPVLCDNLGIPGYQRIYILCFSHGNADALQVYETPLQRVSLHVLYKVPFSVNLKLYGFARFVYLTMNVYCISSDFRVL